MILLDTHVLLWWLGDDAALGGAGRALIADPGERVLVSAVSLLEVETKRRLGKLEAPAELLDAIRDEGFDVLALDGVPAAIAGALDWPHRDPFDRLLVAQSRSAGAPLVTADARILAFEPTALAVG